MTLVVIQARTSSSRLPAKVLLPIAGMPLVVLAARRAANTGLAVVVATSREPSDDHLCAACAEAGIAIHRGDIDDVLSRFSGAIEGLPDDAVVVRLTADNCIPDGALIESIVRKFEASAAAHVSCNGAPSGVPYGVSVEVTRAAHIRRAAAMATLAADREHVTPWIIRELGSSSVEAGQAREWGRLRATIDYLADYLRMARVFSTGVDPIGAHYTDLITRLADETAKERKAASLEKYILGGAQLGMPYGITNTSLFDEAGAATLVRTAVSRGVSMIDTARAYGCSEEIVGRVLEAHHDVPPRIVTKVLYDEGSNDAGDAAVRDRLEADVLKSLHALRLGKLDTLLLHRASQMTWHEGAVWRGVKDLQASGLVDRLGVSVQSPAELAQVLSDPGVVHIQMPFNILDWRWQAGVEEIRRVKRERALMVHVRSTLLQGLLTSGNPGIWMRAGCADPSGAVQWLKTQAKDLNRKNVIDLCIAYVRAHDWVDGMVVGNSSLRELDENIDLFATAPLTPAEVAELDRTRPRLAAHVLDPSTWKKA